MKSSNWVVLVCGLTVISSPAWAIKDPETGESFPNSSKCAGATAKAAAVGVREATFGIDVYAAVLYVQTPGQSVVKTNDCVKIRARFVRDVGAGKIRKAWMKGFKKNGLSPDAPTAKKFLGIISGEMKKKKEMVFEITGNKVTHRYMGRSVTVDNAPKLAKALKKIYVGGNSPVPTLVKDLKKRGVAKP